ncbi:hypothetical protein [Herpetosiphon geysericola]|uniref:Uncharacterized protein n=1 Tax=Herpetosiphon geysericola TaxID=70996 RepID=A0A0P6XJC0_9CHLR|nr:hypothetical protein [Herpetosiphon geysericola]KPL80241.1 hypothetical protein SE18_24615 [Herpetosiphon geysericola]
MSDLSTELIAIDAALIRFVAAMREKLHAKAVAGFRGWNNPENKILFRNLLQEHLSKDTQSAKQMADIANFALMLWWIEILEDGTPTPPPSIADVFIHLRHELGHHFDGIDTPDDLLEL